MFLVWVWVVYWVVWWVRLVFVLNWLLVVIVGFVYVLEVMCECMCMLLLGIVRLFSILCYCFVVVVGLLCMIEWKSWVVFGLFIVLGDLGVGWLCCGIFVGVVVWIICCVVSVWC